MTACGQHQLANLMPLVLYSRNYCHLCLDMLTALEALRGEFGFSLTVVDVDADPEAEEKFDELVPVLTNGNGIELCHYHFDEPKVRAYLQGQTQ